MNVVDQSLLLHLFDDVIGAQKGKDDVEEKENSDIDRIDQHGIKRGHHSICSIDG